MGRRYDSHGSAGELHALLGQWFEEVKLFPTCKGGVDFLAGDCRKDLREVVALMDGRLQMQTGVGGGGKSVWRKSKGL